MTAMNKLVKEMVPLHFISEVSFRNLAEKDELFVRENLRGKANFVLASPPTNK